MNRAKPISSFKKGIRVSENISLEQMQRYYPLDVVQDCLKTTNCESQRNRELPNWFVVYYLMAACNQRHLSQKEVLRRMGDGIQWFQGLVDIKVTGRSGITQSKERVASKAMKAIFDSCSLPIAKQGEPSCFYKDLLIVIIDGTEFDLYDSIPNSQHFGKSSNQHGETGYPKARTVGLMEAGTRIVFDLAIGRYKKPKPTQESDKPTEKDKTKKKRELLSESKVDVSEIKLARKLIRSLKPGMLLLADRLFMAFDLFEDCRRTGAQLLFRARDDRNLKKDEKLSDDSYLSTLYDSKKGSKRKSKVRVVEFDVEATTENEEPKTTSYRLITTLLDPIRYPAVELANLYRQRWQIETMLDEAKNHLLGGELLRSRTPELVEQEIYAAFMTNNLIHSMMYEAAVRAKIDPGDLSFTHAKNVFERYLPKFGLFSP